MTDTTQQPTDKIQDIDAYLAVKFQGPTDTAQTEHQLFMSAALTRRLVAIAQSGSDVLMVFADPVIQEIMIVEACRTILPHVRGKARETYTLEDFIMDNTIANTILDWISKHVFNFFTDAVSKVQAATTDEKTPLKTLLESLSGLVDSTKAKSSAGPTESSAAA